MTPTKSVTKAKLCGSRLKGGRKGRCKRPAGWGTSHAGSGRCKLHGGASPNGDQAAAKERAMDLAVEAMRSVQRMDPTDALLLAVWRAASIAAGYARAVEEIGQGEARDMLLRQLRAANKEQAQIAHMAIQSRVSERAVEHMNRLASAVAMIAGEAFAAGLRAAEDGHEQPQSVFAQALGSGLSRLEDGLPDVEGQAFER